MGKLELKDSILFTNFVEIILTKDPLGEKSKTILTSVTKIRSWLSRNCI